MNIRTAELSFLLVQLLVPPVRAVLRHDVDAATFT
jgi:hypothetical protein